MVRVLCFSDFPPRLPFDKKVEGVFFLERVNGQRLLFFLRHKFSDCEHSVPFHYGKADIASKSPGNRAEDPEDANTFFFICGKSRDAKDFITERRNNSHGIRTDTPGNRSGENALLEPKHHEGNLPIPEHKREHRRHAHKAYLREVRRQFKVFALPSHKR